MIDNFFKSMISEGGKISHKRFISVFCTAVVCFISVWATIKYPQFIPLIFQGLLYFIAVMSGVATVAQIVTLVRGSAPLKEGETNTTEIKQVTKVKSTTEKQPES